MAEEKKAALVTPSQQEIDSFKLMRGGLAKDEHKQLPRDEELDKRNKEAMERMDNAVPTPTQAEVDKFVMSRSKTVEEIHGGKPQEESEEAKKEREENARQREAAIKRMHETVPTPTQEEVDNAKLGKLPPDKKENKQQSWREARAASAQSAPATYQTRESKPE
jgi:hypothetical protein